MQEPVATPARKQTRLQTWTFILLFAAIAYLFWKVAEPLWVPIFLGAMIAVGAHPLHLRFVARMKSKHGDSTSAGLITFAVIAIALGIALFFGSMLIHQALAMAVSFADRAKNESPEQILGPAISSALAGFGENPERLKEHLGQLSSEAAGMVGSGAKLILSASAGMLLVIIFTAITSYYLLVHGSRFTKWLVMVIPIPDAEVWELVKKFRDVTRAMLLGTGVTALYQGVVSFLGYWACGVPNPVVWGTATGLASIIPVVGTTIIWAPIVIFLFATGHTGKGVALLLFSIAAIIGVADYFLRPKLLGQKVKMNELLIFIALFGGIEAFGILGTILGPIVVALLLAMIHIYMRDYRPRAVAPNSKDTSGSAPSEASAQD
jgi:predicted PurR-regulated permease PerM